MQPTINKIYETVKITISMFIAEVMTFQTGVVIDDYGIVISIVRQFLTFLPRVYF